MGFLVVHLWFIIESLSGAINLRGQSKLSVVRLGFRVSSWYTFRPVTGWDVHSAAVLLPLSFALSSHEPVAGRGLQGGAGFLIIVSEGPAFPSWSHTSVVGVGRTIVRNPKVTVHDNCYSFELWSKTVRNLHFGWKGTELLNFITLWRLIFCHFQD